jgi:MFS family permease
MRSSRAARRVSGLALAVTAVTVAIGAALHPLMRRLALEASRAEMLPSDSWPGFLLVGLAFSGTAFIIHRNEPHLVGWVMHGVGLLLAATQVGIVLYVGDAVGWELGVVGRLVASWTGFAWAPALILMAVFLPLLFPSGRPPSRGWWWVGGVGLIALVYGFVAVTVETLAGPLDEVLGVGGTSWWILPMLMATGAVGAMASAVARYRRAGDVERRQLKWVSAAFVLVSLMIVLALLPAAANVMVSVTAQFVFYALIATIPASIGVAVTRYRLYEIDRIISRSVSYAALTLLLAATYAAVVLLLLGIRTPLTGQSELAVSGATLAVAALFSPARRRLQRAVDRRFNRARYDAQRTTEAFRTRLRDEVDLDQVTAGLLVAVRTTMQPAAVGMWIRVPPR